MEEIMITIKEFENKIYTKLSTSEKHFNFKTVNYFIRIRKKQIYFVSIEFRIMSKLQSNVTKYLNLIISIDFDIINKRSFFLPSFLMNDKNERWLSAYVYSWLRLNYNSDLSKNRVLSAPSFSGDHSIKTKINENKSFLMKFFRPRVPHEIIFVIGGWSSRSATYLIETFDNRTNRWFISKYNDHQPRAYHGVIALQKLIYIIGGFDGLQCLNSVRCFDTENYVWSERGCMHDVRCYVSVTALDGYIYAMGGFDGMTRINTAERFDPDNNQWTMIASMGCKRSDASASTLSDKIYIVGGFNGEEILRSAEVYSPSTNTWTFIQSMITPRSGVSLEQYKGYLYVLGGWDGVNRLSSGEKYDSITNEWCEIPEMITPRSNFTTAVLENALYVIGGYNGTTTIPYVECYKESTNEWESISAMNIKRSALGACVIKGLSNSEEFTFHGNMHQLRIMSTNPDFSE